MAQDKTRVARPALNLDWEVYAQMLETSDLTDAQKQEFIETLWSLVVSFVDLGFDLHPVQQACGEHAALTGALPLDVISSASDISKTAFNTAATDIGGTQERSPACPQTPKL